MKAKIQGIHVQYTTHVNPAKKKKDETLSHLICECSNNKASRDRVAKLIYWSLGKKYNLSASKKPWEHQEEKVSENDQLNILWGFWI